jgi:hypothetical protein
VVLTEWAQVRKLYKTCSIWRLSIKLLFKPQQVRVYWYLLWAALVLYFIVALSWFFVSNLVSQVQVFGLWLLSLGVLGFAKDAALVKEYAVEYKKHRIADYPPYERGFYLRYAVFLRRLAEQQRSSKEVGKLARFAAIAGKPEPVFNLLQHPLVAFMLVLLSGMSIKLIPTSISWEEAIKGLWYLLLVTGVLLGLLVVLGVARRPRQQRTEIKRFLAWATRDLKEEQPQSLSQVTGLPVEFIGNSKVSAQ